ncbi:hypothetical protein GE09DRAFT_1288498 [Coniochaeta sp. 2T2.1]|nr:hypothetical protein GE09DRAFT_1288498 [Coniochaeta sp. 2T2.1]
MAPKYCSVLHEQIWFVVTRLGQQSDAAIAYHYNRFFPGSQLSEIEVRHIRTKYGPDPAWGGAQGQAGGGAPFQAQAVGQVNLAVGNQIMQPNLNNQQAQIGQANPQPQAPAQAHHPAPDADNVGVAPEQRDNPGNQDDDLDYGSPTRVGGRWYDGKHDNCQYDGKHRHEVNGGVHFDSTAELDQMIRRMRAVVSLDEYAALLGRQGAQLP